MGEEKTYRMGELMNELGDSKHRIHTWLKCYPDSVERIGENNKTVYTQSTLDALKMISRLETAGKQADEIKAILASIAVKETAPAAETTAARIVETFFRTGQLRLTIDVNIRLADG